MDIDAQNNELQYEVFLIINVIRSITMQCYISRFVTKLSKIMSKCTENPKKTLTPLNVPKMQSKAISLSS